MNKNFDDYSKDLEQIKELAKLLNLNYRVHQVKSLKCVQIKQGDNWVLFDPINRAQDFSFVLYKKYLLSGGKLNQKDFRKQLFKEV